MKSNQEKGTKLSSYVTNYPMTTATICSLTGFSTGLAIGYLTTVNRKSKLEQSFTRIISGIAGALSVNGLIFSWGMIAEDDE